MSSTVPSRTERRRGPFHRPGRGGAGPRRDGRAAKVERDLRRPLVVGSLVLLVLLAATGLVAVTQHDSTADRYAALAQREARLVKDSHEMQLALVTRAAAVRAYIITGARENLDAIRAADTLFRAELADARQKVPTDGARRALAAIERRYAAFEPIISREISLVRQGRQGLAEVYFAAVAQPAEDALVAELARFTAESEARFYDDLAANAADSQTARRNLLWLLLATLLVGGALTLVVARRIGGLARSLGGRAYTDFLTSLANRRAFLEELTPAAARAAASGTPLSLAIIDLDDFKVLNDLHGHVVADGVLVEAARRLAGNARAGDLVGRIGGDEFAWLLPGCDSAAALDIVDRGRRAIAAAGDGTLRLGASAGVCELRHAGGALRMMELADAALYWAKSHGSGVTIVYDPARAGEMSHAQRAARVSRAQTLNSLRALAQAVDAKDHATRMHSERVADLAVRIATALGWDQIAIVQLREAGLLHDVGKIGVPDGVLSKLGPLTDEEFEQVKQHSALGAEIVTGVLSPLQAEWIRGHHERWDGRGYPDSLAGTAIPEGAAVLAVADSWDAMTMERPYRSGRSPEAAYAELVAGAGVQWSPAAVAAFTCLWEAGALSFEPAPPVPSVAGTPSGGG